MEIEGDQGHSPFHGRMLLKLRHRATVQAHPAIEVTPFRAEVLTNQSGRSLRSATLRSGIYLALLRGQFYDNESDGLQRGDSVCSRTRLCQVAAGSALNLILGDPHDWVRESK